MREHADISTVGANIEFTDAIDNLPPHRVFRGSRFTFVVLSRSRIRQTVLDQPYIVISISDFGDEDAEIAASPLCRAILRLQFDDIDPQRATLRHGVAMTEADARAVLDFVREYTGEAEVSTVVCQCSLGISRSAGVAAALSRLMQGEEAFFAAPFSPNPHVYRLVMAAFGSLTPTATGMWQWG